MTATKTLQRPTPAQARALNWLLFSNITTGVSRLTRFRVAINPRTRKSLFAAGWVRVTETVDAEFVEITDAGRTVADRAHSGCDPTRMNEVRMSGCAKGCKVMACRVCSAERVVHSTTFGCQIDEVHGEALEMDAAGYTSFRPMNGPSLATIHMRWLDRGLPAETWPGYAARATEMGAC